MAETGLSLVVSKEMLANLQKADNAITSLATKSEQASKRIISAFTEMGQKGVGAFINKLYEAQQKISSLSSLKINFANIIPNSAQSVDSINKIVQALQQLNDSQLGKLSSMQNKLDYRKQLNDLKQLKALEDERGREITRQNRQNIESNKVYSEQLKTATMQAIVKERERQIELKRSIAEINRLAKAYKAMPSILTSKSAGTLIAGSVQASSINQRLTAIQNLKNATRDLDTSDKRYQQTLSKLNSEIARHKQELQKLGVNIDKVNKGHRGLLNISEQLTRRLALVFSVSQITGYVNKLISVRGEFELQQRALQAILQNKDEANRLWEKTVQLAVQSPFQVKQLVTYTKQLAAYRVESDKLYDTTKMLADVSAGLGVDMQRLILAFGQVKAANYLRGTELRQFSEVGINILGELATYFSELEGITVSVGDVFERVSKRMVIFADVEEIFKRLTSAGGTFYRMQEIQAETLRGQISNLKDSIDIMLNEVGKANEQTLKNSVALVRSFVESWERIVDILQAAGAAYFVVTAARVKDAIATKAWSAANISATASAKGLNAVLAKTIIGLKALWTALLNNPITAAIAGLTALGVVLYKVAKRNIEANKALQESANKLAMQRIESEKYTNILITLVKKENELVEANKSLNKESSQYKNNVSKINELEQDRKNILNNLESVDATYAKNLREIGTDTEKLIEKTNLYNEELRVRIALEKDLQNISSEDFIKDYNTTTAELNTNAARVETTYANTIAKVEQLLDMPIGDGAKKILQDFLNSSEPYVDRVTKLYETLSYNYRGLMGNFDFKAVQAYIKSIGEVDEITKKVIDDISKTATTYKATPLGSSLIGVITNEEATDKDIEKAKNNIIATFEKILDDKAITGHLRTKAQETLSNIFNFKWEKTNATKPLEEWKVAYNDFIATLDQEKGAKIAPASLDTTLEQLRSDIDSQIVALEKSITAYNKADEKLKNALKASFEKDTATLANLKKQRDFLGYNPKETTSGDKDNTWTNLMRVVKEVNTEFKNLNKTFDKTTALQGTLAKYSDALTTAFEGTGKAFADFDFTTESGLIAFYDWLIKVIPEVDKLKAQLAKGEVFWGGRVNKKELEDKSILDQIEKMFSGYEVSLELQKLNIPNDLAKQLFNVDAITLPELKLQVESLKSQFKGKDMLDEWDKLMKRINEMEAKAQQERLKTYSQYLVKAQSERIKIKLEELRKIAEVEKESAFTDTQRQEILETLRNETQKNLDKLTWDEFKDSDLYLKVFEDLEYVSDVALTSVKDKLDLMRSSLNNLSVEDLRIITKEMRKIEEELIQRNPFKALTSNLKDYILFLKERNEIEQKWIDSQRKEDALKARTDSSQIRIAQLQQEYETSVKTKGVLNEESIAIKRKLDFEKQILDNNLKQLVAQGKITQEYANQLREGEGNKKGVVEGLKGAMNSINDGYNAFNGLMDTIQSMFGEFGEGFQSFLDGVGGVVDGLGAIEGGLSQILDGKIISGVINTITGVFKSIGAIFGIGLGDIRKQKEIEREIVLVEDLQKQYEKLNKVIDKAYSISTLEINQKAMSKNIDTQIRSYEKMIALEEDKKNTDGDKIKEYEDSIKELQERQKEIQQEVVSTTTSGILDSVKDAAREFVDAWYEAFAETGDGLQGLKDNFQEIMLDMVQQQASMTIAGNFLDRWKKQLDRYINPNDLKLTTEEAGNWVRSVQDELPMLNEALQQYFNAMEQAGVNLGKTTGDLSGLQAGIKNITEEQAAAIEAYLNSIRFFVAQNNTMLATLVNSFTNSETPNPILGELRTQSEMIRAIRDMFSSVIGRGSANHAGAYLKVAL